MEAPPEVLERRDAHAADRVDVDHSILELRFARARLTGEIAAFLDECWLPRPARAA